MIAFHLVPINSFDLFLITALKSFAFLVTQVIFPEKATNTRDVTLIFRYILHVRRLLPLRYAEEKNH